MPPPVSAGVAEREKRATVPKKEAEDVVKRGEKKEGDRHGETERENDEGRRWGREERRVVRCMALRYDH